MADSGWTLRGRSCHPFATFHQSTTPDIEDSVFQRLTALALVASISTVSAQAGDTWYGDFDLATAAAKKAGKDLFVDFTGSDWCGWCIRLHDEVFGHDEFVTGAQKDFILVSLDFPRSEEALAKA